MTNTILTAQLKVYEVLSGYNHILMSVSGCAGCPFGKDYKSELDIIKKYEPKLYIAICNIFKDSYTFQDHYDEYRKVN